MPDHSTTVAELKDAVRRFADERAWGQFHSPKNLVMGLAIETAELMEHFHWMDCEPSRRVTDDPAKREQVAEELADVACYLFTLSNALGIDVSDSMTAKLVKNAAKYPVEKYRGKYEA